jgi:hypothetical protein
MNDGREQTIAARQSKEKEQILEKLKEVPIVRVACKKAGIGHATFYRWMKDDPEFKSAAEEAMRVGVSNINDLAESHLVNYIREGNFKAICFWLIRHHRAYQLANENQMGYVPRLSRNELKEKEAQIADLKKKLYFEKLCNSPASRVPPSVVEFIEDKKKLLRLMGI